MSLLQYERHIEGFAGIKTTTLTFSVAYMYFKIIQHFPDPGGCSVKNQT